jgi:hypothetical protein
MLNGEIRNAYTIYVGGHYLADVSGAYSPINVKTV